MWACRRRSTASARPTSGTPSSGWHRGTMWRPCPRSRAREAGFAATRSPSRVERMISIVVPAFNEARGLPATLASIQRATAALDARGWRHELIVCDNNSTDRTAEIARARGARVVFEPVNQISRARNAGAAHASGDWLVFIDADSRVSATLLRDMFFQMQNGCLAGGATIVLD